MKVVYTPDKTTLTLNNEPYLWITKCHQLYGHILYYIIYLRERERTLITLNEERYFKQKTIYKKNNLTLSLLNYKNYRLKVFGFFINRCKSKVAFYGRWQVKYETSGGMLVNGNLVCLS